MTTISHDKAGQELDRRVRANQERLVAHLKQNYDFIVCGAGSSGSVVARRLAENPSISVLLLEAGGSDDIPSVTEAELWPTNLGSATDWAFQAEPNKHLNGRALTLSMGKVLGGGSSINVMAWARGHKADWDFFAAESGNDAWSYKSVLDIYRSIEDWHGTPDPEYRGSGGPIFVQPKSHPHPVGPAVVEAAKCLGIASFPNANGKMMEGKGGSAMLDLVVRDGKRQSVFRSYTYPYMDRENLTVLSNAFVRRVLMDRNRATGVEVSYRGEVRQFRADAEVVLSLGAMHTPKLLMLSGIGDQDRLRPLGIPEVQHLPGVGRNLQDHLAFTCVWEGLADQPVHQTADAVMFWPSRDELSQPDFFACEAAFPLASPENIARFGLPETAWILHGTLTHAKSRGIVELASADPDQPVRIMGNGLSHPEDVQLAVKCIEDMREVGNSQLLRPFAKREVMPGGLKGDDLVTYLRDAGISYWHNVGTAKMGRDPLAVVDGSLKVYGVEKLRVVDGSILPRVTAGNTMAPCVVIGERGADEIKAEHRLAVDAATS